MTGNVGPGTGGVTIPVGIAEIRDGTFKNCTRLEVVSLPERLRDTCARAFKNRPGLAVTFRKPAAG